MLRDIVLTVHILSAAVLFGTGAGIAFFMLRAWMSRNLAHLAQTAKDVVLADFIFTTTAVIVQPISGIVLIHISNWPWDAPWLLAAYGLYVLIGVCWLPVVWIQMRVRDLALDETRGEAARWGRINPLMRLWFVLGWPAFLGITCIYFLMVAKPVFS